MTRKIIHIDADCFFAAIEMRDNPELRQVPLAVGGSSDRRGVIATCNYQAREFGVRSAMASAHALKLCPQLVIVRGNMEKYREASVVMRGIFAEFTPLIEPLSLDEAYLDVTDCQAFGGSATRIAQEIQRRIYDALNITVSAGVSNCKFLAKIASDWKKPNGLFVIRPDQVEAFVKVLPVNKIHGVGKVTAAKLAKLDIHTCGDLREWPEDKLAQHFGRFGYRLHQFARGIDERAVKTSRIRKSLSVERTFPADLPDAQACLSSVPALFEELQTRLKRLPSEYSVSKAFVKVKFSDFTTTTLERVGTHADPAHYRTLMEEAVQRKNHGVRLLGLGVRLGEGGDQLAHEQLPLF